MASGRSSPFDWTPRTTSSLDTTYEVTKLCEVSSWRLQKLFCATAPVHYFSGVQEYGYATSNLLEEHFCITDISRIIDIFPLVDIVGRKPWLWPWDRGLQDYLARYRNQVAQRQKGQPVKEVEFRNLFSSDRARMMLHAVKRHPRFKINYDPLNVSSKTLRSLSDMARYPHFLPPAFRITPEELKNGDHNFLCHGVAARLNIILMSYGLNDYVDPLYLLVGDPDKFCFVSDYMIDAILLSALYNGYMAQKRDIGNRLWIGRLIFHRWSMLNSPKQVICLVHLFSDRNHYHSGYMCTIVERDTLAPLQSGRLSDLLKNHFFVAFGKWPESFFQHNPLPYLIPGLEAIQIYALHQDHLTKSAVIEIIRIFVNDLKDYSSVQLYDKRFVEENIRRIKQICYLPYLIYNKSSEQLLATLRL